MCPLHTQVHKGAVGVSVGDGQSYAGGQSEFPWAVLTIYPQVGGRVEGAGAVVYAFAEAAVEAAPTFILWRSE